MILFRRTALSLVAVVILLGISGARPATAEGAAESLTPEQQRAVEAVVREYLLENPEVIVDAIREMRRRDESFQAEKQQKTLSEMRSILENNPEDPIMGNPDGDITVVEFFDYRCGYCKKVFPDVQTLLREDGNIKYILKEWPILGDDSVYASRAAIAVWQGQRERYGAFHTAMMLSRGALSELKVEALAEEASIDVEKMNADMQSPRIDALLATNRVLADSLGITGTPAFIFGDRVVPGAADLATLKMLAAEMRAKKSK